MEDYKTYDVDKTTGYADLVSLSESMEQEIIILRTRNKILSTVNKTLHERVNALQQGTDELISALYEYDKTLEHIKQDDDFIDLATEEER